MIVMVVVAVLLPGYDEVPAGFPATVLYDFRIASLLTQLTLWSVLGVVLATFVGRLTGSAHSVGTPTLTGTRA
jgi:predicted cobalt transporter CbtA